MANAIFTSLGRFFFQFGLASFIISTFFSIVFLAYGVQVPKALADMAYILPMVGLASVIMGVFGIAGASARVLFPAVGQLAGITTYLSLFMPAVTGVVAVLLTLMQMMPLPAGFVGSVTGVLSAVASASIAYYLAVKVGYLPPE